MGLHIDPMPDDETVQAIMYGPLVLAGRFEEVPKEMSYGNYGPRSAKPRKVPDIIADTSEPTAWIEPDSKQPLLFRAVGQSESFAMVPLYKVIHERYAVYRKVAPKSA
jgi:hypothetical protein